MCVCVEVEDMGNIQRYTKEVLSMDAWTCSHNTASLNAKQLMPACCSLCRAHTVIPFNISEKLEMPSVFLIIYFICTSQ